MHGWPFVGREAELSLITGAFRGSDVDAVMVSAPAGMGKTRLARHALSSLDGVRTAWVGATRAAAGIPFGAVSPLLPEEALASGSLELIRAAARQVRDWGGRHGVVIGVDDASLLDDASGTLIAHLVTDRLAFVVMTMRSDEPVPDVLTRLCKEGHAERITLPPLPDTAVDTLIDHAAPDPVDPRQRRRLRRIAGGNPLALRELLHGAQPGGLIELVAARLAALDGPTRQVVELVACGEPLGTSIVERLVGVDALVAAEASGLIVVERTGRRLWARLDHPLYGEVLRSQLPLSRAAQLYRHLAGALLETPLRRRTDHLLAALWQVEGGVIVRPDVVRAGAWQAIGHADLELAERLARAARAAEPVDGADLLLAEILAYRGQTREAAEVLPGSPPAAPADRVTWAITRAETLYWGGEDPRAAWAVLDTAGGHPAAEASRSWLLFFDGRCADAARVAGAVLDNADADERALIWAAAAGAAANGFLGRRGETDRIRKHGLAWAAAYATDLPWGQFEVELGACLGNLACGRPAEAQAIAVGGYQDALATGTASMVYGWALFSGIATAVRGRLDEAARLLDEGLVGFDVNDTFRLGRCGLGARAAVAALRQQPDAADLQARADDLAHPSNRVFGPWLASWRAWTAYALGDLRAAVAAAVRAADLARDAAMPVVEAFACYDLVRLGGRADLDRLDGIDDDVAALLAGAARAMADRDAARVLERSAAEFAERGYDLHAAEAYAVAAHRHHRHDRHALADVASAHAARLRAAFPDAHVPLLRPGHATGRLTQREREVVFLAARHTSREIADRLRLAVPTVNNTLGRAYAKLGINGRTQLRALLSGRSTPPRDAGRG
jgi:DNA-binding CsgD family transcriptional regulator